MTDGEAPQHASDGETLTDGDIDLLFTFIERCKRNHAWPEMWHPKASAPRRTEAKPKADDA